MKKNSRGGKVQRKGRLGKEGGGNVAYLGVCLLRTNRDGSCVEEGQEKRTREKRKERVRRGGSFRESSFGELGDKQTGSKFMALKERKKGKGGG